jgi:hypothetical protein
MYTVRNGLSASSDFSGWLSMNVTMPWMTIVAVASKRRTSSQNRLALKPLLSAIEPPARSIE